MRCLECVIQVNDIILKGIRAIVEVLARVTVLHLFEDMFKEKCCRQTDKVKF